MSKINYVADEIFEVIQETTSLEMGWWNPEFASIRLNEFGYTTKTGEAWTKSKVQSFYNAYARYHESEPQGIGV